MIDAEAASLTSLRGKLGTHKQAPGESMGILRAASGTGSNAGISEKE